MLIPPAYAQAAGAGVDAGGLAAFLQLAPLVLMIRPQQRRMKALQASIAAVKRGDSVVTAGGLIGKVTKVEDAIVEVEIAANTRVRVVKGTIAEVTPTGGAKPAND